MSNEKREVGRPTEFKKEYIAQAYKLCLLGATDASLADFFEVSETTINNWKLSHPEFLESIKGGKLQADSEVAERLYKRATGYDAPDTKVFCYEGQTICLDIIKHYPPDPVSIMFWLKNRQPELWREKHEVEHQGGVTVFKPSFGEKKIDEINETSS